jgi:hypothetical protein
MAKRMERKVQPSPYSNTDEQETLAVDTFKILVEHKRVRMDIKERDKYPNTDGYLELVDDNRSPIGKLEVQIRTFHGDTPKLQCPLSLFDYSEITCNPVLLVGVETDRKKAYWIHVTRGLLDKMSLNADQRTVTISFPIGNTISENDDAYVEEWVKIAESYKSRMKRYPQLENLYNELSKKSNPAVGAESTEFSDIHAFLDKVNGLLEDEFGIVKRIFYSDSWKIGLAYSNYEDRAVTYTLYPIHLKRNDVQIKRFDAPLQMHLQGEGLTFRGYGGENPIKSRSQDHAIEIVENDVLSILEHRLLKHHNEFLARELIFAFMDRFGEEMGFEQKDTHPFADVERAFFQHLPLWIEETMKLIVETKRNGIVSPYQLFYGKEYIDPDMLMRQTTEQERTQIKETVTKRVLSGNRAKVVPIGNRRIPFRVLVESLRFLSTKQCAEIERPYLRKDYSRLQGGKGWIWNVFSPEMVEANLRIFLENLPTVYADLVSLNFPQLAEEIPLFDGASLAIALFEAKETYTSYQDSPKIEFYFLKSEDHDLQIELYNKGSDQIPPCLSFDSLGKDLEIKGRKYRMVSGRSSILDFIFEDLPMLGFVYKELTTELRDYFDSIRARCG